MIEIKQAVILAGGRGMRLAPLTDNCPKPMVDVNGKPFLEHLIIQLKKNGIEEVVLLTGYLKEKIENYFRNGEDFGIKIKYSRGEDHWDTSKRLAKACDLLDDNFFLLYGDNYYNYNLRDLLKKYQDMEEELLLTVVSKTPGNITTNEDGRVFEYNEKRSDLLLYVEIGFMLLPKSVIKDLDPSKNENFSIKLREMAAEGKIKADIGLSSYHSISDIPRLELTRRLLAEKKILLIDRDGTINVKSKKGFYVTSPEDFIIREDAVDGLKLLAKEGFSFIVITNQAGLSTGDLQEDALKAIHKKMVDELAGHGVNIIDIIYSSAHWQDRDDFMRKPNPGMFYACFEKHFINLAETYYIGDDSRDMIAAKNANTQGIFLGTREMLDIDDSVGNVVYIAESMIEISRFIIEKERVSL